MPVARRRRIQQHAHGVAAVVGDDEVGLAVAVDVRHRHGDGIGAGGEGLLGGEGRRGRAGRRCPAARSRVLSASVGDDEVGLAVAVEVRHRHGVGAVARGEGLLGGEGRRGRARRVVFSSTLTVLPL